MGWCRERMIDEAREEGRQAQAAGAPLSDNPYKLQEPFSTAAKGYAWIMGYLAAEHEQAQ